MDGKQKSHLSAWPFYLIGLLVAYFASPILLCLIFGRTPPTSLGPFVTIFYFPLRWMCQAIPGVLGFYESIFDLCETLRKK